MWKRCGKGVEKKEKGTEGKGGWKRGLIYFKEIKQSPLLSY